MAQHTNELSLPVIGMEPGKTDKTSAPRHVYGTAIHIGGGAYLTAAHVWTQVQAHPLQGIGMLLPGTETLRVVTVNNAELLEAVDLAVLRAQPFAATMKWSSAPFNLLDQVYAFGYPHSPDPDAGTLNMRAFEGTIVGGAPIAQLPAHPEGIEVSFQCPRGFSGAPLVRRYPRPKRILGIILGNTMTEMDVYRDTGVKAEPLPLAFALGAATLFDQESSLLGGTIEDWLADHDLVDEVDR